MPILILLGVFVLWLIKSSASVVSKSFTPVLGVSSMVGKYSFLQADKLTYRAKDTNVYLNTSLFKQSVSGSVTDKKMKMTSDTDFKTLFEQWKVWVMLPVNSLEPAIDNVTYGFGSEQTLSFTLHSVERRTDNIMFDVLMRCFMDLLSVDEFGTPMEPFKFKMGKYYGYIPYPMYKELFDRLEYLRQKFNGDIKGGTAFVDEIRKSYFTIIGRPTHNLYGELWTESLSYQNWIIRMYQGFLWWLVRDAGFRKTFPSINFPLTENDNKATTGRNGMPKVDFDGYSNVIIDTDTIGRSIISSYVQSKLTMGKNSLIAKLFKI